MYAGVQFTMMKGVFFMKKIVLLCASGMSTSILVNKMKEAAAAAGKDYEIAAYSASEAATKAADADVVLLGPQIRFSKESRPSTCACTAAWTARARWNSLRRS